MLGEEIDEGADGVEAEGVVAQIDGVQVWALEEGGEEGGEGGWDLGEEAGGEDVGEFGRFEGGLGGEEGRQVLSCWNADGVAREVYVGVGGGLYEGFEVGLDVFLGV